VVPGGRSYKPAQSGQIVGDDLGVGGGFPCDAQPGHASLRLAQDIGVASALFCMPKWDIEYLITPERREKIISQSHVDARAVKYG